MGRGTTGDADEREGREGMVRRQGGRGEEAGGGGGVTGEEGWGRVRLATSCAPSLSKLILSCSADELLYLGRPSFVAQSV